MTILSAELAKRYAEVTVSGKRPKDTGANVFGTVTEYNGSKYVKLDGSDQLTPVTSTTDVKAGDRVTVHIENHAATVTGNVSSPSARTDDVREMGDKITEVDILVADKVSTWQLEAEVARIDDLESENISVKGRLDAAETKVGSLEAEDAKINGTLTANQASIDALEANKLDADVADVTYATIDSLEASDAYVRNLEADYAGFKSATADDFQADRAAIDDLKANKLDADSADIRYANVDFANIGEAALRKIFADSGIIKDIVVSGGTVTGELVGVTIKGDLIEGNTIVADKLVVKGTDGLYYKLNTDGMGVEAQQTDYNSLNGSVIRAKSITATKINVSDLVAFGATIGGFKITDHSLYSGVKKSAGNSTRGVFLGDDGQVNFGDAANFVKYYKVEDEEGVYRLAISADSITLDVHGEQKPVASEESVDILSKSSQDAKDEFDARLSEAMSQINMLVGTISTLVTDSDGASMMTQTEDGWTFSMGSTLDQVQSTIEALQALQGQVSTNGGDITALQNSVKGLSDMAAYVRVITSGSSPVIELGNSSGFKVQITNTSINFMDGTTIPAYINNEALQIKKAEVQEELRFGNFVWMRRANGNMGLLWRP